MNVFKSIMAALLTVLAMPAVILLSVFVGTIGCWQLIRSWFDDIWG